MADRFLEMRHLFPPSYVAFLEAHDGWEGLIPAAAGSEEYVVLWPKGSLQEYYDDYEMAEYLDRRWFAIGSNGGGEMLCLDLDSTGQGVYWLPFIGMSGETPILRHRSFDELAARIKGQSGGMR